jgi:hypothetical protein
MSYASVIDKAIEEDEEAKGEGFTESDEAYIRFRRVVESGMVNAGFDLIPSKSSDVTQRSSGEKFTDQTLRGHILNGAAFGARFNDTLKKIDPSSSLSQSELLNALALFACHDFHKTDEPQKRRLRSGGVLGDEDKDLSKDEVRELMDTLRLEELDTDLCFRDYYASALGAEKMSGRHKQVSSKRFDVFKDWVRLMDAAAGMQSPAEANSLENRVQKISSEVSLHYHSVDGTRGVSTNILNHAISEYLTDNKRVEDIVYFHNGVIYIAEENGIPLKFSNEGIVPEDDLEEVLQQFINSVKESREELQKPQELRGFLNTAGVLPKGYLKINSTSYFLSGIENIFAAVREDLESRSNQDNWSVYSVYSDGLIAALAWDLVDETPMTHNKTQALGIYAGTVFMELFKELNAGNARESLIDLCNSLELDSARDRLLKEYDAENTPFSSDNLSMDEIEAVSESTGIDADEVREDADSVDLHGGGNKSFAQVAVMAFLNEDSDGVPRRELPVEEILQEMESMFLSYYQNWEGDWDDNRGTDWDSEWDREKKTREFERELQGELPEASEHYIRSNVEIDVYWFAQEETKDKLNEYIKKSQGHICLLCNDLLIGDTSLSSFESGQDTVGKGLGFSHLKKIDAGGGEPNGVLCPICDLEMTLRNSVHETNADESSQYLVIAPDYFYSPVDIKIEKILKSELYEGGGGDLLQTSRELVGSDPSKCSEAIESVLSILKKTEEQEEFQNSLKNYDTAFDVKGSIGVYRLSPPRRANDPNKEVTRVPRWYLASYFAVVFSWLTSSRVLLTDTPIPTTEFDDFNEMIQIEGSSPPVQRFVGETVTISRLGEREVWTEYEFSHLMKSDDGEYAESDTTFEGGFEFGQATLTQQYADNQNEETQDETTTYELRINTGLAESLYKLSAFSYVGFRAHGFDVQRFATLLSDLQEPFVGASTLLKGDERVGDYTALRAADILDTLIHPDMSNRLEELAEVGFEAAQPNPDTDSNHEYERLFRVARDSISDGVTKDADRGEMIDMVAGDVMKAAARARKKNARTAEDEKYAKEKYTREPAEEFARVFIDDVFISMCDGEFYELRRLENKLASGYNAAIRRKLQEWFDEYSD